MSALKKWLFVMICILCCGLLSSALAEITPLPIDFSGGKKPDPNGFIGEWEYEDPSIHVKVVKGRAEDYDCDYWAADITIADASQLRTMSANGFDSNMTMNGEAMARRVKAVLAIDGDYFCYTGIGCIIRQGQTFRNILQGDRDVLLVDEDGDFHIVGLAKKGQIGTKYDGKKIINAFFFGPALVVGGTPYYGYGDSMSADSPRQRMAIAQLDHLHYMCICCAPPIGTSCGMTLWDFGDFVASLGVEIAYNLDGGDSVMMIFNGEKINATTSETVRDISDIVYFASAWTPDEK